MWLSINILKKKSFWASVNNRESPSLGNRYILFANITERYSRNTNIFKLCSLIFHKIYQGRNNNNDNVQQFQALCRKQAARDLPNPVGKFMNSSVFSIEFVG